MPPAVAIPPDEDPRSAEAGRLAQLRSYGILDTGPDAAFDRLTRLAAEMVGVPIAAISLVDLDRQWSKATVGPVPRELPRDLAFCAHAICQDEPLVVADAMLDRRFCDNPLVTGDPHIRFYAGAQLTSPQGHHLGTLFVADTVPRLVSADQLRQLTDLADAVVTTMELQRTLRTLAEQAYRDPLTGLFNRRQLTQCLERLVRPSGSAFAPFTLLYIGCDDLKEVNDTFGREVGDDLLRRLGRELPNWVRPNDIAARMDGDEFALLLPATLEQTADGVANRVLENAVSLMLHHGWPVTLSIGAATFTSPPENADRALSLASAAMSDAKLRGKRQVRGAHFPPHQGEPTPVALGAIQQALRAGLERDELFLQYQPIVPLDPQVDAAEATGVEALVRWRHPVLGILQPSHFIPGAEKSGLIVPLGDVVLTMALKQMRIWLDAGHGPAWVSVNVSGLQLRAADFAVRVLDRLREHLVPPERLILEITEGTLIDVTGTVLQSLTRLADGGVRLAIDDFGTGYSSLQYLRDLPIHTLKIDRTFVKDIVSNPRDLSIVGAIVAMARTLQLATVAEGIETEPQRALLAELGCGSGQGWLFGRPA